MTSISKISSLTKFLDEVDPNKYAKIIKKINIDTSEVSEFATWRENDYTRNCLARTNKYELILICWNVNADSSIHCHGGNNCWVYQIEGTLEECRYKKTEKDLELTHKINLEPTKLTFMHDSMGYHKIGNITDKKAMSLHIYANPIDTCTTFNEGKNCFEPQELSYDTFKGEKVKDTLL